MNQRDKILLVLSVLDPDAKADGQGNVTISIDALVDFCNGKHGNILESNVTDDEVDAITLLRRLNEVAATAKADSAMTHLLLIGFHQPTGGILIGGDSPMPLDALWQQMLNPEQTAGKLN